MISPIIRIYIGWLFTLGLCGTIAIQPTQAQPIVPGTDTNTQVNPDGNTFNIEGGTLSEDGSNLFHTFTEFGLSAGEIANFMSNPQIQNILTRINGGNPSIINGLIQVTGGQSNLFLMNPSGILFGSGASLNVPGSFMATTADRIGLSGSDSVQWFDAKQTNLYSSLVGNPSQFVFSMPEAAAIVNAGNLGVGPNQNLILLGGSVVSTGTLSAQGNLIVAGVPGQSLVRISQVGHLLSFEVDSYLLSTTATLQSASQEVQFDPQSLPELLAGGGGTHATGVELNSDGTVTLTGSGLSLEHGDVSNRAFEAQTAIVFATGSLTAAGSQLETTGNLHLQADNGVRFEDSPLNPVEVKVGRNLQIRGDRSVTLDLLNHPDSQIQVQGNLMVVSEGNITLDGTLHSGGNLMIFNTASQPTGFQSRHELALIAGGNVVFENYTGGPLRVDAIGGIQGGTISLTIAEEGNASPGGIDLSAGGRDTSSSAVNDSLELSPSSIVVGEIAIARPDSSVSVQATGSIQTGAISTEGGDITLSSGSNITPGAISTEGGDITLSSAGGGIDTTGGTLDASASSNPQGGAIALTAENPIISGDLITENNGIQINGPLQLSDAVTFRTTGSAEDAGGGNIQVTGTINGNVPLNLEAGTGDVVLEGAIGNEEAIAELSIDAHSIDLRSTTTSQGPIAIDATGTVTLGDRLTTTEGTVHITATDAIVTDDITTSGGSIDSTSQNSQITTGNLESGAIAADGGTISLRSFSGLSTGAIDTHSTLGAGGNVTLHTEQNDIQASFINTEGATIGGNVSIQTSGAVRIVNSFLSQNGGEFSISTAAPQGGEITITHGRSEFVIGDLDGNGIIENGAIAAITTGSGEFLSLGESVSRSRIYLNPNPSPESSDSETASESEATPDETATDEEETDSSDASTPSESDPEPEEETPEETDSTPSNSPTDLEKETPPV
ncbi:MAG: filamentous hemagglutinin N-terminal domain-containing protein, partial [Chroococcales cyanobacterium]